MRYARVLALLALACFVCVSAFGDEFDPVGFCSIGSGGGSACTTGVGIGGETIPIGSNSFYMYKNGSGTSTDPWYFLLAVPNDIGGAPTVGIGGFTQQGSTADFGQFLPTTKGSIYGFTGLIGDASMNASNMFGANEQAAFGGTPSFFEIYVYTFTPGFDSKVNYTVTVGGSGLVAGTFVAASGGSNPFSTPFTTTGLANGVPDGGMTLILLGSALVGLAALRRSF